MDTETRSTRDPGDLAIEERPTHRVTRAVIKTVCIYSLAIWTYAAAVGLVSPNKVSEPFLLIRNFPRTDTMGIVAFAISALTFTVLGSFNQANEGIRRAAQRHVGSVLRTLAVYGFIGWVYVAANVIWDPQTIPMRLTHLANKPTEAQFGIVCLVASAMGSCALWSRRTVSKAGVDSVSPISVECRKYSELSETATRDNPKSYL